MTNIYLSGIMIGIAVQQCIIFIISSANLRNYLLPEFICKIYLILNIAHTEKQHHNAEGKPDGT